MRCSPGAALRMLAAFGLLAILPLSAFAQSSAANQSALPTISVHPTEDFEVLGGGHRAPWQLAEPFYLRARPGNSCSFETTLRLLYSETGLYILVEATDSLLNASLDEDYLHLWTEDVFEAFIWPDEDHTIYFEYELSPLGYELPLIIPNFDGEFLGWIPWDYEGERKIQKKIVVRGGEHAPGAAIEAWFAEIFIPYALLRPLQNVPPRAGTQWRANFYRNDYDGEEVSRWAWSPTTGSYHDLARFGTLLFK